MMTEKTAKQHMMEMFLVFGKMFQLARPEPEYVETMQVALRSYGWKLSDFRNALGRLVKDDTYAETARFGKYPTIHDFLRVKRQNDSAKFYAALSAYLSGEWWQKDIIAAIATPEQSNAILLSGGLDNLYNRAHGDIATPVYKLIDLVAKNESDAPSEIIDTSHRIGAPRSVGEIAFLSKK